MLSAAGSPVFGAPMPPARTVAAGYYPRRPSAPRRARSGLTRSEAGRARWAAMGPEERAASIARLHAARGPMTPERRYHMKIAGKARWYNMSEEERSAALGKLARGTMAYRADLAGRGLLGKGKDIALRSLGVAAADHGITMYRVGKRIRLDFPYHGLFIDVGASNIHLQREAGVLQRGQMRAIRRGGYDLL